MPRYPTCLTKDAARLVEDVRCSDSGHPQEGWDILTGVEKILEENEVSTRALSGYHRTLTVTKITAQYEDGTVRNLYVHSEGYEDGYSYEVSTSLKALQEVV
jgi:hypothetical protein